MNACLNPLSALYLALLLPFNGHAQNLLDLLQSNGLPGGLVVQVGGGDTEGVAKLSRTGRYIINVLDEDPATIASAQSKLRQEGNYGIVSAEILPERGKLPYSENLVNAILVQGNHIPVEEMFRVLTPDGLLIWNGQGIASTDNIERQGFLAIPQDSGVIVARKPRPSNIDSWSHPRHAASGNAVSSDTAVGPPRRIRWVAAARNEVEGMVTAGGRNYYGGMLARDSFNGLRIWHVDIHQNKHNSGDFDLPRLSSKLARPVASEKYVFAVVQGKLVALDGLTGETIRDFGDLDEPRELLFHEGSILAADENVLRAYDVESGSELWSMEAGETRNLVAGHGIATFIQGRLKRGEKAEAVTVDIKTGKVKWRNSCHEFLRDVQRTVLANGQIAYELSSFNDDDTGNGLKVVSAETGSQLWEKAFPPGMNHRRQARAMYLEDKLWILHGGKTNYQDKDKLKREPVKLSSLDPATGEILESFPAGLLHCFPPVATPNFMFAGTLDMTNLKTGEMVVNRITKANCSQENGWIPANGLVYTTPKHCTCWPMLRGFVSMAPEGGSYSQANRPLEELVFPVELGKAKQASDAKEAVATDWPLYRNDPWRSGSTKADGPGKLETVWSTKIATEDDNAPFSQLPGGPIQHDWKENPVIKGPLSAPTIANGMAYVTRPNAHEVIAVDISTGKPKWRFTADGRVDTPPAIFQGLALFGTSYGFVYALRADTGEQVWKMQAAPSNERIVAYGQVESPWPVPGAVLIQDGIAYFAAGRQPLADGGILVFAVDPFTAKRHWVHRIDTVPQKGDYENSGLDFDPFDILHAEGDRIALSRWLISKDGKNAKVDKWNAFAKLDTGAGSCYVPRGSWTYGARHQHRFAGEARRRPLTVFRDKSVFSSLNGTTELFRRDFDIEGGEEFSDKWITGWAAATMARKGEKPYRTYKIAEKAKWVKDLFAQEGVEKKPERLGTQLYNRYHALALAENALYVAHEDGRLLQLSKEDGSILAETQIPTPAWDGMAIAEHRIFLSTQTGELLCIGVPFVKRS